MAGIKKDTCRSKLKKKWFYGLRVSNGRLSLRTAKMIPHILRETAPMQAL